MPPRKDQDLSDAELAVLRVLWDHGPMTVREVMQHLHERGRRVAYTTVMTFLSRLEQKGVLTSDKGDVAYVYRPRVTREHVTQTRLRAVLDELFDGAAGPAVLHLVENQRLTPEERARLRAMIDELDRTTSR
jgi:predicted transcriptional regulator